MALDIGISALNMMFKLAKAIKEAQTDVLFIIDKVNDAESLSRLVEVNMARLDLSEIPEGIYKEILKRNVAAKRLTRKLRLKYEPLLSLFSSLGGNATAIKVQASMLKRSVDGGAMGLNSLCILVDRHLNRLENNAKDAIIIVLKEAGKNVDKYEKYSLGEMCKMMREADQCKSIVEPSLCNRTKLHFFLIIFVQPPKLNSTPPWHYSTSCVVGTLAWRR